MQNNRFYNSLMDRQLYDGYAYEDFLQFYHLLFTHRVGSLINSLLSQTCDNQPFILTSAFDGCEQKAEKKPYWYILVGLCTGTDDQFELRKLATYKNYL